MIFCDWNFDFLSYRMKGVGGIWVRGRRRRNMSEFLGSGCIVYFDFDVYIIVIVMN